MTKDIHVVCLSLHDPFKAPSVQLPHERGKGSDTKDLWHDFVDKDLGVHDAKRLVIR